MPNFADPQSLNRFTYVRNNPLKYIDPTGHGSVCGSAYSDPECPTSGGSGTGSNGTGNTGTSGGAGTGSGNNGNQPVPDAGVDNTPPPSGSTGIPGTNLDAGLPVPTNNSPCCTPSNPPDVANNEPCGGSGACIAPPPDTPLNGGWTRQDASQFFSDMSTSVDQVAFAVGIANPIADLAACALFTELGCVPAAALVHEDLQIFEAGISWVSTGFAILSDITGGRTGLSYDPNSRALLVVVGQDTVMSTITSVAGTVAHDPITDTAINTVTLAYDSARNQGGSSGREWALIMPLRFGLSK